MMRTAILLLLTASVLWSGGCAADADGPATFHAIARDREALFEHLEREVAIIGKAETTRNRGVVVVLEDGTAVGVSELDDWPKKVSGETVTVTGRLRRLATPPDPNVPGSVSRELFLLEGARWRPGDNPPQRIRTR